MARPRRSSKYDRWLASIETCGHLYTQMDCGCLAVVMLDEPWTVNAMKADFAAEAKKGRLFKRCGKGELPPLNCPTHEAERLAKASA